MRSIEGGVGAAGDLSTRARLRDAAIRRFAIDGFGAGLRAIAADAGMSAGVVIHHFGSKEQLRSACDAYVFARIREAKREVVADSAAPQIFLGQLGKVADFAPLIGYAIRSLQAGGVAAKQFVDHLVTDAVGYISEGVAAGVVVPSRDEHARARYLVEASLGGLMLELSINPLDAPADLEGIITRYQNRLALPSLELFTDGFLVDRRMLDAYLLYVGDPPGALSAESDNFPAPNRSDPDETSDHEFQHPGRRAALN